MPKKHTVAGAAIWSFIEKFSTQAVGFVMGLILARLLTPTDYGTVGLMSIFLCVSNVFIEAGFSNALIRKNDRTDADLSTAFIFNCVVSLVIYLILFLLAPLIAHFFEESILIPLVRIAGLNLVLGSLCIVQRALLTIDLRIKAQTYISLASQVPAGLVAIYMAYKGFGVYSLAIQAIIASIITTIAFWVAAKWRPTLIFSRDSFNYLLGFGSKLVGANLIGVIFDRIYTVLIGKYLGKTELGYYSKGDSLNNQVFSVFNGMVQRIALPILSKSQYDKHLLASNYREIMRLLVMINAIIAAFLFFSATDIVVFLWTDKWLKAAEVFRLLAVGSIFIPISSLSLTLLQVVGRTGLILRLEFPKKAIYAVIIAIAFNFGVTGLCIGIICINLVAALINMYATKKVIDYNYILQLVDIFKYFGFAFAASFVCSLLLCHFSSFINILLLIIPIFGSYFLLLYLTHDEVAVKYCDKVVNVIKSEIHR